MHEDASGLARRLRERRLAKRALDLSATELPADTPAWPSDDPDLQQRVEDRLAREVGLGAGELFLDFPAKPDMLALDLPLVRRNGTVTQLGGTEAMAHLGLPRVGAELYRSARRLAFRSSASWWSSSMPVRPSEASRNRSLGLTVPK